MGRTPSVAGGRPFVVNARLSKVEMDDLDARRGSLDRGAFLRYLLLLARKQDIRLGGIPTVESQNRAP